MQSDNTKTQFKLSITQRLQTDLEQSVVETSGTQLVFLTGLLDSNLFH